MNNFENGLCNRINERIKTRGFCVIYDHELCRLCPPKSALRKKQLRVIEEFATRNGLEVRIREIGLNATFKRKAAR
jgi:hypothetical protein